MKGKSMKFWILTVICLVFAIGSTANAAKYNHQITVKEITFAWKVDGAKLDIQLSARTRGWVGIGFNPTFMMKGARFVLGYVKDGKVVVSDQFGTESTWHEPVDKLGGKSDVTLLGGKEVGDVTTINFSIPLVPTDGEGKKIDPNAMTTVLLAYGPNFDSFMLKHKFKTRLKVNLATGKYSHLGL